MTTDAIVLLKNDHKEIKRVFREFEKSDDLAHKTELASKMIELLTIHTYIENQVMYPEVQTLIPDLDDEILESYEEHHVADVLAFELSTMPADNEHFLAKAKVLIENVEHHIEEEEQQWFPKVRDGVSRKQLQDLGARMAELKKTAPTSPTQPKALQNAMDAVTA